MLNLIVHKVTVQLHKSLKIDCLPHVYITPSTMARSTALSCKTVPCLSCFWSISVSFFESRSTKLRVQGVTGRFISLFIFPPSNPKRRLEFYIFSFS